MTGHLLSIDQMPPGVSSLLQGRAYHVQHDGHVPILGVLWSTLLDSDSSVWVTARDVGKEFSAKTPLSGRMQEAVDSGRIRVFCMGEAGEAGRVVEELAYYGVKKGTLVAVEAEVAGDFRNAAALFREFAVRNECTLLLVSPQADAERLSECLSGSVRFRHAEQGAKWELLYWFGPLGLVTGASFDVFLREDGTIGIGEKEEEPRSVKAPSGDEDAVFITRAALSGKKPPEGWKVVEDFAAAEIALAGKSVGTLILHYDPGTVLGDLTRLVFKLRQSCGNRIRILVRQINAHLRHSQEQLLLKLGATFVIPAEVLFAHLDGFVGMLKDQVYSQEAESDYEEAVAKVMPSPVQGYLKPQEFVAAVRETIERTSALLIQNVLLRLLPVPGLTPEEVLKSCWMKRKGDICTADEEYVFLFLFACREGNIDLTLDRQFSYPVSVLFEGESYFLFEEDILGALVELSERTKEGIYPEITLNNPLEGSAARMEEGWPPSASESVAPRSVPAIAVRRTIPIRKAAIL